MTPRQIVTVCGSAWVCARSPWLEFQRRSSGAGACVGEGVQPVNRRVLKTSPNFLPSFSVLLKHLPGAAVNASERCASQSLKVADDPRGGLLFRLWLHRPKARLWLYEFAWISCSSSRTLAQATINPSGILWILTHSSYILFCFFCFVFNSPLAANK